MARPACIITGLVYRLVSVCPRFRFRLDRLAPRWSVSARPVKGGLRLVADARKCFFR